MTCIPFKYKHYSLLMDLLNDHKCAWVNQVTYKTLPKIGYITLLGNQPVAIGFIRMVEGGYGQLDTFATSPHFGSKIRNDGLNLVVDNLLCEAKDLNLLGIIAITKDQGIIKRSEKYGFSVVDQTLLVKSFS